ncbi:MAG: hypothetical protein JWQ02_3517 [Capsulimonas sp.]|nr:hypothetical protein [Capsulimonas sp.]
MPETLVSPAIESIARAKSAVISSRDLLLSTFSYVPDDKLHWSPSPSARTPLQIAAHCGGANATFATLLRGEPWPLASTAAEAVAQIYERDAATDISRDNAAKLIEDSSAALIAALENATPATLETMIWTAFGEFPYDFAMTFPAGHMAGHARQIDYLQTIWGDREDHN